MVSAENTLWLAFLHACSLLTVRLVDTSGTGVSKLDALRGRYSIEKDLGMETPDAIEMVSLRDGTQLNRCQDSEGDVTWIPIGALLPLLDGRNRAIHEMSAIELAVQHVNTFQAIPGGYCLLLHRNNTHNDPGIAMDKLYYMMYRQRPRPVVIIGGSSSNTAEVLSENVNVWNVTLLSYATRSPILSDKEKYPRFYRTATTDASHNGARAALLAHYSWDAVALIEEEDEEISLTVQDLCSKLETANVTLLARVSVGDKADISSALDRIKNVHARIIITNLKENMAAHLLCQVFKRKLFGPQYVWILPRWQDDMLAAPFHATPMSCSVKQIVSAMDGHFTFHAYQDLPRSQIFLRRIATSVGDGNAELFYHHKASVAYDSVWLLASLFTSMISSLNDTHRLNPDNVTEFTRMATSQLEGLRFTGLSGPFTFEGSDVKRLTRISQRQGGSMRTVAIFDDERGFSFTCHSCSPVHWKGKTVPVARPTPVTITEHVNMVVFVVSAALSIIGAMAAVFFLIFNLRYRNLRYIKLSSPKLGTVAATGCILIYFSILLMGLSGKLLVHWVLCLFRVFLMMCGFSLAFGALFTKIYRVFRIFTALRGGSRTKMLVKDAHLLAMIGALVIVDCVVTAVWTGVDPMYIQKSTSSDTQETDDRIYTRETMSCKCRYMQTWSIFVFSYKGLLLVFGMYMSWQTRQVQVSILNDSQYVAMSVYNVVISSVIIAVASRFTQENITISYGLMAVPVYLSTTCTLGLLFVPKVATVIRNKGKDQTMAISVASNLIVQGNTRRFKGDEEGEKRSRAEIQNSIYKRELRELERQVKTITQKEAEAVPQFDLLKLGILLTGIASPRAQMASSSNNAVNRRATMAISPDRPEDKKEDTGKLLTVTPDVHRVSWTDVGASYYQAIAGGSESCSSICQLSEGPASPASVTIVHSELARIGEVTESENTTDNKPSNDNEGTINEPLTNKHNTEQNPATQSIGDAGSFLEAVTPEPTLKITFGTHRRSATTAVTMDNETRDTSVALPQNPIDNHNKGASISCKTQIIASSKPVPAKSLVDVLNQPPRQGDAPGDHNKRCAPEYTVAIDVPCRSISIRSLPTRRRRRRRRRDASLTERRNELRSRPLSYPANGSDTTQPSRNNGKPREQHKRSSNDGTEEHKRSLNELSSEHRNPASSSSRRTQQLQPDPLSSDSESSEGEHLKLHFELTNGSKESTASSQSGRSHQALRDLTKKRNQIISELTKLHDKVLDDFGDLEVHMAHI